MVSTHPTEHNGALHRRATKSTDISSTCSVIDWHVKQNQCVKDESLFVSIKPDRLQELEEDDSGTVLEVCMERF